MQKCRRAAGAVALSFRLLSAGDDAQRSLLVNAVDVIERQRLQDLVTRLAEHDSLTGLANRRRLEAEVKRIVTSGEHDACDGALMLIDLDNFKQVNDALGHHVGAQLLVELGRLLTEQVSAEDLVGRLDDDEFVIVLPTANRGAAEAASRRIVEAVDEQFAGRSDETSCIRASIGFSMFTDPRAQGIDPFRLADRLMYDAKTAGRSRTAGSTTADGRVRAGAPGSSVADVRAVLESDDMRIDLQRMLDLRTGRIALVKALPRIYVSDYVQRSYERSETRSIHPDADEQGRPSAEEQSLDSATRGRTRRMSFSAGAPRRAVRLRRASRWCPGL